MGSFSIWHWLVVLLVVVLIFGTKKLRNIGSDVGGAVKNFKEAMKGEGQAGPDSNQAPAASKVETADMIEAEFVDVPVKKAAPKRKAPAAKKPATAKPKTAATKPRTTATKKSSTQ